MTPDLLLPIPFAIVGAWLVNQLPGQDTPYWRVYLLMAFAGYVGAWVWWVVWG